MHMHMNMNMNMTCTCTCTSTVCRRSSLSRESSVASSMDGGGGMTRNSSVGITLWNWANGRNSPPSSEAGTHTHTSPTRTRPCHLNARSSCLFDVESRGIAVRTA